MLLLGVEFHPAGAHAVLVGAVEGEHERGHRQPDGETSTTARHHDALAGLGFGVQRLARAARTAAHGEEEDRQAEQDPEDDDA